MDERQTDVLRDSSTKCEKSGRQWDVPDGKILIYSLDSGDRRLVFDKGIDNAFVNIPSEVVAEIAEELRPSAADEPTVYGPLANEMLATTAYGDHESVRDCLATLADRLENLEVVVYVGTHDGDGAK